MDMFISDFIIHIQETLTEQEMNDMTDAVREHACVVSAGSPSKTNHLLMVAYDTDCARSSEILKHVTNHGVHAFSVGL
ncbi:ATP-binding protein [Sulfuriferula nivalis]|uniref:Uncharacterized protein n=1 Tax=Sulfuriferula nivalis TaxID=2675298 RepID=A0A809SIN2_9PROT|nr:ATP-binding protein [Sulfuriferula nivalis]BBP02180.1 hypothetical protein SFSGTM_28880 [Sulfuriferula nivalis]